MRPRMYIRGFVVSPLKTSRQQIGGLAVLRLVQVTAVSRGGEVETEDDQRRRDRIVRQAVAEQDRPDACGGEAEDDLDLGPLRSKGFESRGAEDLREVF